MNRKLPTRCGCQPLGHWWVIVKSSCSCDVQAANPTWSLICGCWTQMPNSGSLGFVCFFFFKCLEYGSHTLQAPTWSWGSMITSWIFTGHFWKSKAGKFESGSGVRISSIPRPVNIRAACWDQMFWCANWKKKKWFWNQFILILFWGFKFCLKIWV